MNHRALSRGQWSNSIFAFYRIVWTQFIARRHRTVNTTNCWTWLVHAKNAAADITTRMTVIILYIKFITKIICDCHRLFSKVPIQLRKHKIIFRAQAPNHHKAFSFLWDAAKTCVKDSVCQSIPRILIYRNSINKFLCFCNPLDIFHYEPLRANF